MGNIPLAAVLWNGGISFGGVVAFVLADLIVLPILDIYRRYYGMKMTVFILAIFYISPAQVDSYRGFIFACLDPAADNLYDYLAGAREYLALVADQSEVGMKVVPGQQSYSARANWKLMPENSVDGYHTLPGARLPVVLDTFTELSKACGSSGWATMIVAGCTWWAKTGRSVCARSRRILLMQRANLPACVSPR